MTVMENLTLIRLEEAKRLLSDLRYSVAEVAEKAGFSDPAHFSKCFKMILHICGDTSHLVKNMCATGAQGLSLDSPVDLARAAREVDPDVVLIGNIDPVGVMVQETPEGVRRAVRALLDSMEPYENFILSTGCDLPYETPFENIDAFMKEGRL